MINIGLFQWKVSELNINDHQKNLISIIEYRILGKKGEGTFSEVLKCQNVRDGTFWAAKKMKQLYKR